MAMTRGFKLFHTLFLVLVCQYCAMVCANKNVNGFFDSDYDDVNYDKSFGDGVVGVLNNKKTGTTLITGMTNPLELTPSIGPVGFEVPKNAGDEGSMFGFGINKNIKGEVVSKDKEVNLKNVGKINVSPSGINNRKIKDGIVSTFKWW